MSYESFQDSAVGQKKHKKYVKTHKTQQNSAPIPDGTILLFLCFFQNLQQKSNHEVRSIRLYQRWAQDNGKICPHSR